MTPKTSPRDPASERYEDALTYLEAVVRGDLRADSLRVAAAKIVLPYQKPKVRAPVQSPAPRHMREVAERQVEHELQADFNKRADEVRKRLAAKRGAK